MNRNVFFAASLGSNPLDGWCWFRLDLGGTGEVNADQPHIGFEGDGIYISTSVFNNSSVLRYSQVFSIEKATLDIQPTNCSIPTSRMQIFRDVRNNWDGTAALVPVPAVAHGLPGSAYFLNVVCNLCVGQTNAALNFMELDCPSDCPLVKYTMFIAPSYSCDSTGGGLPQAGTAVRLQHGEYHLFFPVVRNAYYRAGHLVFSHQKNVDGKCILGAYDLDPVARSIRWYLPLSDASDHVFMPSIAISSQGDVIAVFGKTSNVTDPGVYYSRVINVNGLRWQVPIAMHSSTSPYTDVLPGDPWARWGDYYTAAPDYTDGSVWIYGEYVRNTSTWATYGGRLLSA